MTKKSESGPSTIAQNKKARFDYFIEDRIEAGLALQGWEVKSMRAGKAQLTDSFVIFRDGEAYLLGSHVAPLNTVSTHVIAEPKRTRKLLMNRREIDPRAPAPMQKLGVALDIVDEIEHLLRRVRNTRAALDCWQMVSCRACFFGDDSRIIAHA